MGFSFARVIGTGIAVVIVSRWRDLWEDVRLLGKSIIYRPITLAPVLLPTAAAVIAPTSPPCLPRRPAPSDEYG